MPNFNYENPTNVNGSDLENPEDRLFRLVMDMLAYDGYQKLTLGEICEKGAAPELVSGYESAFDLCEAALLDAAERVALIYGPITEEARGYLAQKKYDRDESIKQLERLLYRHIYQCFHPKNRRYVLAAAMESQLPQELQKILTDALQKSFGEVLTQMIMAVSEVKNEQIAAMMSCAVCGSINIFVLQPQYCENVFVAGTRLKPNYAVVEDFLNNYFLRGIVANTAVNKLF